MTPIALREFVLSQLVTGPNGCLLWTGAVSTEGYGRASTTYVHRVMYEWFVGAIPDGMNIDHLCRVRLCAAPAHLEAVTPRENILRGTSPAAQQARQTHCVNGHEFSDANTYIRSDTGGRRCNVCHRERQRSYYRAQSVPLPVYTGAIIPACPRCGSDLEDEGLSFWCSGCRDSVSPLHAMHIDESRFDD